MQSHDVRIRPADTADASRWDSFLDEQSGRSYACHAWSDILACCYGATPRFLIAEKADGTIRGILAGYINRGSHGRQSVYSVRHGLVAADDHAYSALLTSCRTEVENIGARSALITSGLHAPPDGTKFAERTSVILRLGADEEETLSRLRRETRVGIKRSVKRGAETEWGFQNLNAFYEVYSQNMLALGASLHRLQFFEELSKRLSDKADLIVVRAEGRIVAGMIVLWSSNTLDLVFGAWLRKYAHVVPYQRMYWDAIVEGQRRGVRLVDMGESRKDSGTWRYKRNFGGESVPTYYPAMPEGDRPNDYNEKPERNPLNHGFRDRWLKRLPSVVRRKVALARASRGRII